AGSSDHRVTAPGTIQDVVTGPALQMIDGAVTGDHVIGRIAESVDGRAAGECQILDIAAECEGDRGLHGVGSLPGVLQNLVTRIVDSVSVVTATTLHQIGATAPVQVVGAAVADDDVGKGIAGPIDVIAAREREILQVRSEG